jgi:hypothetical protein
MVTPLIEVPLFSTDVLSLQAYQDTKITSTTAFHIADSFLTQMEGILNKRKAK